MSWEDYQELKTPHRAHAGQNLFGGWENSAICAHGKLVKAIKEARLEDKGKACEKDSLDKIRTHMGVSDQMSQRKKKKARKVVTPPPEDTPTKDGFNLAFECI